MTSERDWPWKGQIYEVLPERQAQIPLMRNIPGLTKDEIYFLMGIVSLASANPEHRTDQQQLQKYLEANSKPLAPATIKIKVLTLFELGLFERYEIPRLKTRPAVVFQLRDIAELLHSQKLLDRESSLNRPQPSFTSRTIIPDDPTVLIEGSDEHKHAYSRKINHVILRRCSSDPAHLGKKVPIILPGYKETVFVVQRVASGIPPMDGTEDRLQQALLTMFKEHLMKIRMLHPSLQTGNIKNEWLLDMREVCRSMKLKPSSGNITVQAKRLYQLRHNTFEIHFDPAGAAAKALNLLRGEGLPEYYKDEREGTLHSLTNDRMDQFFLSMLEPIRDEIVWSVNQQSLALEDKNKEERKDTFNASSIDDRDLTHDSTGKLYRFYRVSFHPLVYQECLDDALGQLHKQPPSLLEEERVVARLLVYLAQRVIGKTRERPFEASWQDIATEIQPLQDNQKLVFQGMEKVFKAENPDWSTSEASKAALHGYIFETLIPPGKQRRRAQWKLRIWRDTNHSYTGDFGPSAVARFLSDAKKTVGLS